MHLMPSILVNNPNISIIPASSSKSPNAPSKQAPISTVNMKSQGNIVYKDLLLLDIFSYLYVKDSVKGIIYLIKNID